VYLTREGTRDYVLFGRESASGIDSKPDATDIGPVTAATAAQGTSPASYCFEDAAPATTYEATLAGVDVWPGDEGLIDLIPAGGRVLLSAVVRPDLSADVRADISSRGAAPIATGLAFVIVSGASSLVQNDSTQFTATGYNRFGQEVALSNVVWSADAGVISQSGLYTAGPVGVATVTATAGTISGRANISVLEAEAGLLLVSATEVPASTTITLSTEGEDDWTHYALAVGSDENRKSGVSPALIPTPVQLGTTRTDGRWYGSGTQPKFAWTGGAPTSEAETYSYRDVAWADQGAGNGWRFEIDVGSEELSTIKLWVRAYSETGNLSVSVADASITPYSTQLVQPLATPKWWEIEIEVEPLSATSVIVDWTAVGATGNIGIAGIALTIGTSAPPALTSWTVTPASVTVVEGAQVDFNASPRDQYNQYFPGEEIDTWGVSGGGNIAATANPNIATFTAAADGEGGPYTVTATGSSIPGTAAVTVTAASGSYPEIAFDAQYVADAIAHPFWNYETYESRGLGYNIQRVYLGLVAALHPTESVRNAAAQRAKETVTWMLASNTANFIPMINQYGVNNFLWAVPPYAAFFALCRRVPLIYNLLTPDDKERMDTYMRIQAWGTNMYNNPDHNDGQNEVGLHLTAFASFNYNKETPFHALPAQLVYWGSLSAYNAELAKYSLAYFDSTAGPSGYNWSLLFNLRWPQVVASLTSGATLVGTDAAAGRVNTYASGGAKQPLTVYKGKRIPVSPDLANTGNWVVPSAVASITPANVYIRNEVDENFSLTVKDSGCGLGDGSCAPTDAYGRIAPGYTTPYLGQICMAQEYNLSTRSSQPYVVASLGFSTVPMLAMLMATGWWKSPNATHDAALERIRKGLEIVYYRENRWWNPAVCKYENSTPLTLGNYGYDVRTKMFNPPLEWPGENV
jgi:hypothetical protein